MAIHVMENYVSVDDYAKLCRVPRRTVIDRINAHAISAIKVDGYLAVNIVTNPPLKDMRGKKKRTGGGAHVTHTELCCVVTWCHGKNMRSYPYLRAIINGKLNGIVIGGEVFANKTDMEAFRKNFH